MVMPVQLTRDKDDQALLIRACGPGVITINETVVRSHLLLAPDQLQSNWPVTNISALTADDLAPAVAMQPEVIILGTGDQLEFPAQDVSAALLAKRIGFEVMDTRAACRTYNVLVMDGRPVVAALLQLSAK